MYHGGSGVNVNEGANLENVVPLPVIPIGQPATRARLTSLLKRAGFLIAFTPGSLDLEIS